MVMRTIFIIMLAMIANSSFGYFYFFTVKKTVDQEGFPRYIILLADYHDRTHPANKDQRMHLESLLKRCNKDKVKLIVEDLSSVNNDGRMVCCNFGINVTEGVLSHLANKARSLGIAVDNVEYRYCRVAGVGPLINNLTTNPHSFRSSCGITLCSLYKEIADEIEKIKKYNDGKKLNNYYKRVIADVRACLVKMNLGDGDQKKTIAHYCARLRNDQYRKRLEHLCIFDSALIDSNVMHAIKCCDKPIILVVAGGSHIIEVNKLLDKMDYESVLIVPDNHQNPVDITVLDKYILFN